jgi:hypothetical protein
MTRLESNPVRSRADVRAAVDEKLGHGVGMSPFEAWKKLSNVERVEWVLGELWFGVDGARFHLWIQGQAERDFDGPRYVAAIGRLIEAEGGEVGALMRWTAERGRAVRAGERGEALFSIVPLVWEPALERAGAAFKDAVERWPEGLTLADMDAGEAYVRSATAPAPEGVRYPGCVVGFTADASERCEWRAERPDVALETALFALWRHGASDAELEELAEQVSQPGLTLGETLAAWVDFDGAGAPPSADTLAAFARSLDPVAGILGIDSSREPFLHRVRSERLDELAEKLKPYGGMRVQPTEEATFLIQARRVLRLDPYLLLLDSADLTTDEEITLVCTMIWAGVAVVMGGDSEGAKAVLKKLEEARC